MTDCPHSPVTSLWVVTRQNIGGPSQLIRIEDRNLRLATRARTVRQ